MAYVSSSRAVRVTFADRVTALITVAREAAARRRVYAQTMAELNMLTDRELNDLGIARSMISRVARDAAYGA